jgi:hypothetical protein
MRLLARYAITPQYCIEPISHATTLSTNSANSSDAFFHFTSRKSMVRFFSAASIKERQVIGNGDGRALRPQSVISAFATRALERTMRSWPRNALIRFASLLRLSGDMIVSP